MNRIDARDTHEVLMARLDARMARAVRRAVRATLAPVRARIESAITAAAGVGEAFTSVDDLAVIASIWPEVVDTDLLPIVEAAYRAGGISALRQLRGGTAAIGLTAKEAIRIAMTQAGATRLAARSSLIGFGDALWEATRDALLDGFRLGESIPKLADRVAGVADVIGYQAEALARTAVVSASNAGGLESMRALGEFGPVTKVWLSAGDDRVRPSHAEADGQMVGIDEKFIVGGWEADYPGDPNLPAEESISCRCTLVWSEEAAVTPEEQVAIDEQTAEAETAALSAAAGEVQTGAMVALVPSDADAARLAIAGFELPEEMHVTLAFLGEADAWPDEPRRAVEGIAAQLAAQLADRPPIVADLHGLALFNAASDNPCAVYLCGDTDLAYDPPLTPALACLHEQLWRELDDYGSEGIPDQHSPYVPHLAVGYGADLALLEHAGEQVTFDRLRVAWAGEVVDFPFGSAPTGSPPPTIAPNQEAAAMTAPSSRRPYPKPVVAAVESAPQATDPMERPEEWHGVLVLEGQPTLEKPSRLFESNSLEWRTLPFPLMWMEVDSHGGMPVCPTYQVGLVTRVQRNGNKLEAWGVWDDDPGNEQGVEARRRVEQGILRWGSVDVGDVGEADVELVFPEGEAPEESGEPAEDFAEALFSEPEQVVFHHGRVTMWTLVPNPAFEEAVIEPIAAVEPGSPPAPNPPAATVNPVAGQTSAITVTTTSVNGTTLATNQPLAAEQDEPAPVEQEEPEAPSAGAAPVHHTTTTTGTFDQAGNEQRLAALEPLPVDDANALYAWLDATEVSQDGEVPLSGCQLLHHDVDEAGTPGAASVDACAAAIDGLNAGSSGIPDADRQAVYDHLAAHVADAGEAPAELMGAVPALEPLAAAAYRIELPDLPPAEWFEQPPRDIMRRGALTITDEGRVYGLLAPGGTPHVGRMDRKTVPLRSVDYRRFMRGETPVLLADGSIGRIVSGNLTMGCGHAATTLPNGATTDHYDNSCSLFATARCGEADGDVWVAGALLHGVEPDQVRRAMACQLSGHWNPHELSRGRYELLGALLVPVPGFPHARSEATQPSSRWQSNDSGELTMVASAVPVRFERTREPRPPQLGPVAARIARDMGRDHGSRAERIAARVRR